MALSNTAVPRYYGKFRDAVIRGEIPVCKEVSMEMNRIDDLIANPGIYYDDKAVEGWIKYCEAEMTLTDGSDLHLLDSFKLWGEQVFGWYYFVERTVYEPNAGWAWRPLCQEDDQETANQQAVSDCRKRCCQISVRLLHSIFL